jgi:hypothetical protein
VSFRVVYYLNSRPGKPQYLTIGRWAEAEGQQFEYPWKDDKGEAIVISCTDIDAVRHAASAIQSRAARGKDPRRAEGSDLIEDVAKNFLEAHSSQRTFKETKRIFATYILPEWNKLKVTDIKRSHVMDLTKKIAAGEIKGQTGSIGTPAIANATFKQIRALLNWYADNDDQETFQAPRLKAIAEHVTQHARTIRGTNKPHWCPCRSWRRK